MKGIIKIVLPFVLLSAVTTLTMAQRPMPPEMVRFFMNYDNYSLFSHFRDNKDAYGNLFADKRMVLQYNDLFQTNPLPEFLNVKDYSSQLTSLLNTSFVLKDERFNIEEHLKFSDLLINIRYSDLEMLSVLSRKGYDLYFMRLRKRIQYDQFASDLVKQNDSIYFNADSLSDQVFTVLRTKNRGSNDFYKIIFIDDKSSSLLADKWPRSLFPDFITAGLAYGQATGHISDITSPYTGLDVHSGSLFSIEVKGYYQLFGRSNLMSGLFAGIAYTSAGTSFTLPDYSDLLNGAIDKDGQSYKKIIHGTGIHEDFKLNYLSVPFGFFTQYHFKQGWKGHQFKQNLALTFQAGLSVGIPVSNSYSYSDGMINYEGLYHYGDDNYPVLLHDLDEYNFGTYPVAQSAAQADLNPVFLNGHVSLMLNLPVTPVVDLFAGPSYTFGLTNITHTNTGTYTFSTGRGEASSLITSGSKATVAGWQIHVGATMKLNEPALSKIFPGSQIDALVYDAKEPSLRKTDINLTFQGDLNFRHLKIYYDFDGPVRRAIHQGTLGIKQNRSLKVLMPPAYALNNYFLTLYYPENYTLTTVSPAGTDQRIFTDHLIIPCSALKDNHFSGTLALKEQAYGEVHVIVVNLGVNEMNDKNKGKDFNAIKSRMTDRLKELLDELGNEKYICYVPLRADFYRVYTNFDITDKSSPVYIKSLDSLIYNIKYLWTSSLINDSTLFETTKKEILTFIESSPSRVVLHYIFMDNSLYKNDFQTSTIMQRLIVRMADEYQSGYVIERKKRKQDHYGNHDILVYMPDDDYIEGLIARKAIIESMNTFVLF
jgi:hypothetical protein